MKSLARRINRRARVLGKALWAIADQNHPVLVHIIPMRRCNLTCTYCNEYDAISKPVPLELMRRHDISGLPVVGHDGIPVGILTNRDVRFERNLVQRVADVMTRRLITVRESVPGNTWNPSLRKSRRRVAGTTPRLARLAT